MADPNTADGRQLLEAESPLNAVQNIRAPLLIAHGANDQRVRRRESDQIVVAVRNHGIPVQYLVAADEGHGFAHPLNNLAIVAAMEEFFATHLGGRQQEGVPEEVASRLKKLSVDPWSIELT